MAKHPTSGDAKALRLLGERVRKARLAIDLSQESAAFEAGIHVNSLSSIERGISNPSFLVLLSLARVLKVKVSALVGD
jgi:transcriptional regulator with XRE-family HTH domain